MKRGEVQRVCKVCLEGKAARAREGGLGKTRRRRKSNHNSRSQRKKIPFRGGI